MYKRLTLSFVMIVIHQKKPLVGTRKDHLSFSIGLFVLSFYII